MNIPTPSAEQLTALEIENIAALPAFYELVEFVANVCLRNPNRVSEIINQDQALAESAPYIPNVWASRIAMDRYHGVNRKPPYLQKQEYPRIQVTTETVLAKPESLGPAPIPEVQLIVRAIGEAILEEA